MIRSYRKLLILTMVVGLACALLPATLASAQTARPTDSSNTRTVLHKTTKVDGLEIFYREAGPKEAPTIVLAAWIPHQLPDVSQSHSETR